jgi:peptidoglycan hydrolase-like protein with peptidoglycan-binding domain
MLVKIGDYGDQVKYVQEWLCYNKINVVIDSDFGPATKAAVKEFQGYKGVSVTGVVNDKTWSLLNYPIDFLNKPFILNSTTTLSSAIAEISFHHYIVVRPIEIGGQNKGPFVRFYMHGKDGSDYPWCAGAVSTIVLQAFKSLDITNYKKFSYQMGCDALYSDAKKYNTLTAVPSVGGLFLSYDPSNPSDCTHVGIVTSVDKRNKIINTFEGNTNDSGSREGYEYVPRIRSFTNKYFINLG